MPKQTRTPWTCQECNIAMEYKPKQDFHKCPQCGTEVWYSLENISSIATKACGLRNDQHEKLNDLSSRANGCFEGNFR